MCKIAFNVGGLAIHWYGILAAVGFLAGLWTASRRAPRYGIAGETMADFGPWVIVGALVGARLWFVVSYWQEEFAGRPLWEIFNLRAGGLVFYGGLVGSTVATLLFVRRRKVPLWTFADAVAPSIALGHAFGRAGCLMNGCCYGLPTKLPWAIHLNDDPFLRGIGVHPTQIYEGVLLLALYGFLAWQYRRKQFAGQTFALYLLAYAPIRFCVEIFRGDYGDYRFLGLKPGQAFSVVVFAAGIWCYARLRPSKLAPASPST